MSPKFSTCIPSKSKLQLTLSYIFMVVLNISAAASFQQAATSGYAHSYVQPDGKTFSIWGIIYTLLFLLCVFGADQSVVSSRAVDYISYGFVLNGMWLIMNGLAVTQSLSYWAASFVLVLYAACLWTAYFEVNVNYRENNVSVKSKFLVFAPLSLNIAWVTLAAVLNFTNTIMVDKTDFSKKENRCNIGGPDWAMGVFVFAGLLSVFLCLRRVDFVYALGTVWALSGVVRAQTPGSDFPHAINGGLRDFAQFLMVALGIVAGLTMAFTLVKLWLGKGPSLNVVQQESLLKPDQPIEAQ